MKQLILIISLAFSVNAYAQDDKTVTLVVSGQGKTQDEAKQNALRSAIEQSFGTFISSETVINNDSFVSDNITSLSQGAVLSFKILTSNILPDSNMVLTLSATVSISQMQKITESKGYVATIAGGVFGINLKLLKLQAAAEAKVILDMARKSLIILNNSLDYKLDVLTPIKSDIRSDLSHGRSYYQDWKNTGKLTFDEIYKIRLVVESRPNSNLDVFIDYFISTLEAVKMSQAEIEFAKQSGSEYYRLTQSNSDNTEYYLRNYESVSIIYSLFSIATLNLVNYDIVSNDNVINYTPIFKIGISEDINSHYKKFMDNYRSHDSDIQIIDSCHYVFVHGLLNERKVLGYHRNLGLNYPTDLERNGSNDYEFQLFKTYSDWNLRQNSEIYFETSHIDESIRFKTTPCINNMNLRYQVLDYYMPLSEVEKLDTIKIIKHNRSSSAR